MLKPSELFERLHNEGRECKVRLDTMKVQKDMRVHREHKSWYGKDQPATGPITRQSYVTEMCACAKSYLGQAIGLDGGHGDAIMKSFDISSDTLGEIENRYEGICGLKPHTLGQLAEWLKSNGH